MVQRLAARFAKQDYRRITPVTKLLSGLDWPVVGRTQRHWLDVILYSSTWPFWCHLPKSSFSSYKVHSAFWQYYVYHRDLRIVFFFRLNRILNRIGRPIRFRIEYLNRISLTDWRRTVQPVTGL